MSDSINPVGASPDSAAENPEDQDGDFAYVPPPGRHSAPPFPPAVPPVVPPAVPTEQSGSYPPPVDGFAPTAPPNTYVTPSASTVPPPYAPIPPANPYTSAPPANGYTGAPPASGHAPAPTTAPVPPMPPYRNGQPVGSGFPGAAPQGAPGIASDDAPRTVHLGNHEYVRATYLQPARPVRPSTLGLVALIVAAVVFALSIPASIWIGGTIGPNATRTATGFTYGAYTNSPNAALSAAGVGVTLQLFLGSALGLWALVQGIVAVVTRRGRKFGVWAIVISGTAPILSLTAFITMLLLTLPPRS